MNHLSSLIRNYQTFQNTGDLDRARRVQEQTNMLVAEPIDHLRLLAAHNTWLDFEATSDGEIIPLRIASSFHGPTVRVEPSCDAKLRARVAKALQLKLEMINES